MESDDKQWRKQQIRMHALEMAVNSCEATTTETVIARAIAFEDYIFRSNRDKSKEEERG
jgi:hypothetical protein